jgi:hypothetical protein
MNRIQGMEASLSCFVLGLVSLVPVLGLPAAIFSIFRFAQGRAAMRNEWNPAEAYLYTGLALAGIGLLANLVLDWIGLLLLGNWLGAGGAF